MMILNEHFPEIEFESSENFIDDGLLDSFDIILLITELEKAFDILIDPLDILPEYFSSVGAIAGLVQKSGCELAGI